MDDYPIPVGVDDLNSIRINIQEALQQFGFHGDTDVNVHCKLLECDLEEKLRDAGIFYFVSCKHYFFVVSTNYYYYYYF